MVGTSVFALGGNALMAAGEEQSFANMLANVRKSVGQFKEVFGGRDNIVITHGNGPQVGEELLRSEYSEGKVPGLPFYVSNAETQAQIGIVLEMEMRALLDRIGSKRDVVNVMTHVVVDGGESALKPVKPVGPYYTKAQLRGELGRGKFDYMVERGRYRKIVASPVPERVLEIDAIKRLAADGTIVIACGGGGVPILRKAGGYRWINGVIDKDLATAVLASSLRARQMVILTDVDFLYSDYPKKPIKLAYASKLEDRIGAFEAGTIRPKVEACVSFIQHGGREAMIGNLFKLDDIMAKRSGTVIH